MLSLAALVFSLATFVFSLAPLVFSLAAFVLTLTAFVFTLAGALSVRAGSFYGSLLCATGCFCASKHGLGAEYNNNEDETGADDG